MNVKQVLPSQYLAALAMLKQAILKCPPDAWDNPQDKDKFWFVAYHTLRYAHLLQLYNIRHIQQHTGELYQRLSEHDVKLNWASARHHFEPSLAQSGRWRHDAASPKEKKK